jgi:ABC-2 type transport system ATP-binding protein
VTRTPTHFGGDEPPIATETSRGAESPLAIETTGLGKRFGSTWALQDCSLHVPRGRICALVGPNGAGKTTLLRLLAGLASPSAGIALVLGRRPQQSAEFLADIGYLAQEAPLYRRLTADDHMEFGRRLNPRWNGELARERLSALRIPCDRPVGTLSGGQRAQVALGLALAKCPRLLLLDEPVAALDPLARREFLASLAQAMADADLTILLSSHLLHDLERVCDHIILLSASHTQLCEEIDQVLRSHRSLVGTRRNLSDLGPTIKAIRATQTERQSRILARVDGPVLDPSWEVSEVDLETIVLAYMGAESSISAGALSLVGCAG